MIYSFPSASTRPPTRRTAALSSFLSLSPSAAFASREAAARHPLAKCTQNSRNFFGVLPLAEREGRKPTGLRRVPIERRTLFRDSELADRLRAGVPDEGEEERCSSTKSGA